MEGDIVKLGRVVYRVKQLGTEGALRPMFPSLAYAVPVEVYEKEAYPETPMSCRICLSDSQTDSNPLISPCKCAGTMKFIHIDCLQEWLRSRLNCRTSGVSVSYFWQTLDCELCKEDFPTTIQIRGANRDLVEVHKPNSAFIVLEDLRRENSSRGLHVVSMTEGNFFKLGRGHDCDIRIADISVSRLHATMRLSQGGFYIEDHNSKFGTLVQARNGLTLTLGVPVTLQVNRTTVVLKLKQPWRLFRCCVCFRRRNRSSAELTDRSKSDKGQLSSDEQQNTIPREDPGIMLTGEIPREAATAHFALPPLEECKSSDAVTPKA